jgi:hypothetical protein
MKLSNVTYSLLRLTICVALYLMYCGIVYSAVTTYFVPSRIWFTICLFLTTTAFTFLFAKYMPKRTEINWFRKHTYSTRTNFRFEAVPACDCMAVAGKHNEGLTCHACNTQCRMPVSKPEPRHIVSRGYSPEVET